MARAPATGTPPAAGTIRIGIGGWVFPPWRGTFYPADLPQKRELEYASRQISTIEINGTYYGSQKPESFAKWHDETPDDFMFAVKAPRFATNRKVLADAAPSIERFLTSGLMELKDKLGPINWQFMATKQFDPADFAAFLDLLPASHDGRTLRHAVEVRHASFRAPEFTRMLRERGIAAVVSGDGEFPQIADATAPFVYARILGTVAGEPLGYSAAALDVWAGRARDWAQGVRPTGLEQIGPDTPAAPRDVYLYVISGEKVRNPLAATALIERIA